MMKSIAAVCLTFALNPMLFSAELSFVSESAPEWDQLFQRQQGWLGADGNYSVPMGDGRTLWLFSDTWVGKVKDGRRVDPKMINNSVALQTGEEKPEFFYPVTADGDPDSLIKPADGRGFFWLFGGVRTDAGLYLVLRQVEILKPGEVFGFQGIGSWLGHVENPDVSPLEWKIEQRKMPCSIYTNDGALTFASAILRDDDYLYLYGNETRKEEGREQGVVLARVREEDLGDFTKWRYHSDGEWQGDFTKATPICPPASSEYSVSFLPVLKKYAMVYTEGLWGQVVMRTSPDPVGPWDEPVPLHRTPEMEWEGKIICYAGKAHPQLAAPDELLITYAANSLDVSEVIEDARLYWPRFVRVKFSAPGKRRP